MTPNKIGFSFLIIGVFLLAGKFIRTRTKWLQDLFLPSSIIGGFLALGLGPDVLGRLTSRFLDETSFFYNGLIPEFMLEVWRPLSGLFISIIFAALLLAKPVPSLKKIWNTSGPQIVMGHMVAWGQYVVGLLLTLFVLTPFFGMNPLTGALIEISFVGGHGTAAGLLQTFDSLGYSEGGDLALGLATVGIFAGVVFGIAIINIGFRKKYTQPQGERPILSEEEKEQITESYGYDIEHEIKQAKAIEPLAFHLSLIAIAILFGYIFQEALIMLEAYTWGAWTGVYLFTYLPLFPLAMIGGIVVQMIFGKLNLRNYIDPNLISMISGFALDILLVSSLATLSLDVIGDNFIPFLLICFTGIAWNLFAFLYLGPRMIPDHWFERGLGDFGQSTGMAATGLLLMKIADPENKTPALEGFGYKQIMFEPFVGGGLVTSASLPLIYQFGPVTFLIITSIVTLFFLIFGLVKFRPKN